MKIWAHRGCSQRYPENTITSFSKALELFGRGLTGIELDIQLTKDKELVVIHDEKIDRTTDGYGFVRDYTLEELKSFHIHTGKREAERIPTMKEVLDLLADAMKKGFLLNIELKNSIFPYPGMEEKIVKLISEYGLEKSVVYSSFYAASIVRIKELVPDAGTGMLDKKVSDCLYKAKSIGADALHPFWQGMDFEPDKFKGYPVRAWLTGHLYPEKPTGGKLDLAALEEKGITDVFLNEPEMYL
ncbi:MAG: hypothetical protein K6F53_04495 [Lachnospiraceae bacterium]|nr:hypothetical protein [Lachnospiraceae bacterium]